MLIHSLEQIFYIFDIFDKQLFDSHKLVTMHFFIHRESLLQFLETVQTSVKGTGRQYY